MMSTRRVILAAAAIALLSQPCPGLINPKLQPWHLMRSYRAVLMMAVTSKERDKAVLVVRSVSHGAFAPKAVTVTNTDEELIESFAWLAPKGKVVAFAGAVGPAAGRQDVLLYVGGGSWARARMDEQAPARWAFGGDADEGKGATSSQRLFGTFNGSVASLERLLADYARGAGYFPAEPFTQFSAKRIGQVTAPGGAAIADLNADGRLDLLACGRPVRLFCRTAAGAFEDGTARAGLTAANARSVSIADADGDGRLDLLLDRTIWRGDGKGGFRASGALPGAGGGLLSSAFVEIDGDGKPDVVLSRKGAGLAVLLNTAAGFRDATEKLGLSTAENGAGGTGYFDAGDWDGDGRTDLFYTAECGTVLYQNRDGTFEGVAIRDKGDELPALGTAAFGYVTRPAAGLFLAAGDAKLLLAEQDGDFADVTRYGNEIQDPAAGLRVAVAEDLNADGTVDLYAAGGAKGVAGFFVANRGYGSFLLEGKYAGGKVIPPAVYGTGATGLAVGDVTGDGANDVLVVGTSGAVTLLVNETLAARPVRPTASTSPDARKRARARVLTIIPRGTGARGSVVTVRDAKQRIAARRRIGGNIATGCAGPARTAIALREPSAYRIEVRFADGYVVTKALTLLPTSPRHRVLEVSRSPTRVRSHPSPGGASGRD